jgi:alkanesulfonate monooxygenase SsuD/methylene tetrahydromethanopterin reductase-like flavin-dependent oxidoreductase (luciferase family)
MAESPADEARDQTPHRRPGGKAREFRVDFGLLLSFRNPPPGRVQFSEIYRKHFDIAALAEALGYGTIWLTEHHFIEDGYSPSLLPIAAAIGARTRRIRIGTFVIPTIVRRAAT